MKAKPKLTEGAKHDQQKRRFSLFPTIALYAVVDVLEYGARKYAEGNWRDVENARERYYNAAMRHINDWWMGERNDPESGHHHLAHACCCIIFLLTVDLESEQ
jgi:Domain of unknown function (DUF5664)